MSLEWIMSACIGVGLAACCGFRVFVPLLIASVANKLGFVGTMAGFEWLSEWPALIGLSVATIFEIGSYYIPWLDNFLDTLATPASIMAGTLVSTSFFHIDTPVLQWGLGLILGGGSAGIVQAGTTSDGFYYYNRRGSQSGYSHGRERSLVWSIAFHHLFTADCYCHHRPCDALYYRTVSSPPESLVYPAFQTGR